MTRAGRKPELRTPARPGSGLPRVALDRVDARLREAWGITHHSIPADRLDRALREAQTSGRTVCVKIPSRTEFDMSVAEAAAVLASLRNNS